MRLPSLLKSPGFGFFLASFSLLILGICLHHDLSRISSTVKERANIRKSLYHSTQLLSYLSDAESGQRGFLLTGEEDYLAPYYDSIQAIEQQLTKMKSETIATRDPIRWRTVESLINKKLFLLGETLKKRRAQGGRAMHVVPTSEGHKVMDEIRVRLASLQADEKNHLQTILNQYDTEIAHHSNLLVLQGVIVVLLALLGYLHRMRKLAQSQPTPANVVPEETLRAKRASRKR